MVLSKIYKKDKECLGWTDGHAREQKRQANGNKTIYIILLKVTAKLREHNKCIAKCIDLIFKFSKRCLKNMLPLEMKGSMALWSNSSGIRSGGPQFESRHHFCVPSNP